MVKHYRENLEAAIASTSIHGYNVSGCGAQIRGYALRTTCTEDTSIVTCKRCLKMLAV